MIKPTILLIIRHGETEWNKQNRIQGQADIPLNAVGHQQAEILSKVLINDHPDIAAIYASDLIRAVQTAEKSAKEFQLEIGKNPQLREIHYGVAEGLTNAELLAKWDRPKWNYTNIPEAETYQQVLDRAKSALLEIAQAHSGKKVAIFSHGRTIRTLIEHTLERELESGLSNCEMAHFIYENGQLKFIKLENALSK